MAITQYYVDPAIAGDSGTGTIGDPFGDVQYALDTVTRDSTNGDQFNIKAGTDEILGASLDLSTYGTPTYDAPLFFRGYTSAANDGGIGGISGGGTYGVFNNATLDYIGFIDMHLHNSGAARVCYLDSYLLFDNCEINNSSWHGLYLANYCIVNNCYIHDIGHTGVYCNSSIVQNSTFKNSTKSFVTAVNVGGNASCVRSNIISISGGSLGVTLSGFNILTEHNTIYSTSGTGRGIRNDHRHAIIKNNYIEGFSGAGGIAILNNTGDYILHMIGNRYYNNTSNFTDNGITFVSSDNSAVGSSALTAPGSGDFSVGTDLKAGAYPTSFKGISTNQYLDIGAAQREELAGGGGGRRPRIRAHGV